MPPAYFLDTSALLPRYLRKAPGNAWVGRICDPKTGNIVAIAEVTEAELAAAMNQLVRGGILRRKPCDAALALFWRRIDAGEYSTIAVTAPLIRRAAGLCKSHALKGFDAVQLSCAIEFREGMRVADVARAASGEAPFGDPIFLTADSRLRDAALAEGFTVDSPRDHP